MAKKSKVARNEYRKAVVAKYAERRRLLKDLARAPQSSPAAQADARQKLQQFPRDASPTRVRNRGYSDGRPRGYLGKFGLSRIQFRESALRGELPGVTTSSW